MLSPAEALVLLAILTLSPGLDTMLTLRQAIAKGTDAAIWTVVGVAFSLQLQTIVAGAGLSLLVQESPAAFAILKTAGSLFLLYLGGRALYSAWRPPETPPEEFLQEPAGTSFALGAVTNLLNPKVVLFYLSFLPQAAPEWAFFEFSVLYGAAHALMGLLWLGFLVFVASSARKFLAKAWVKRGVDVLAGLTFVTFGILAWLS